MVRAVSQETFQPKIGFKTRYGMVSNPFVGSTPANGLKKMLVQTNTTESSQYLTFYKNSYFRIKKPLFIEGFFLSKYNTFISKETEVNLKTSHRSGEVSKYPFGERDRKLKERIFYFN